VLVLDEADRMIEDGHFKEMNFILNYIYTNRVEIKKNKLKTKSIEEAGLDRETIEENKSENYKMKEKLLKYKENDLNVSNFYMGKNLEGPNAKGIDFSKVVDLVDEDELLEGIDPMDLVVELDGDDKKNKTKDGEEGSDKKGKKGERTLKGKKGQEMLDKQKEDAFAKEYQRMGGIQHIICSATLTIDVKGRITPKSVKRLKKQGVLYNKSNVD
jgi:hypothetical protein